MRRDRRIRLASAAALMLSTLPLGACSSARRGARDPFDAPQPRGAILTVENQHVMDMRVYLVRGQTRFALGTVYSNQRQTFALPTSIVAQGGTVQLMADPIGSRNTYTSDFIPAWPGDHVRWTLAASLAFSHFTVRHVAGG
jgi:hypothetical protein